MMRLVCLPLTLLVFLAPLAGKDRPPSTAAKQLSPAQAWQRLKDGNARFVADRTRPRKYAESRAETAKGQKPFAVVLACADSRTGPELVFDQGLGKLFVVRVAGNVTDPVVLGSVEYAVTSLHAPLVVVLGHEDCGAVGAVLTGGHSEGNLGALLKHVHVGKDLPKDKAAAMAQAVRANARYQAAELTRRSAPIRDFVRAGRVQIVTGVYDLESGRVRWLDTPARTEAKPAPARP